MPDDHFDQSKQDKGYFHIYNQSVSNNVIFNSQDDLDTFTGFLKEYLSPPLDPASYKKEFTIKGKTYNGTPRRVKNYYKEVELLAYHLQPDSLNLLVKQNKDGSLEKFMRSLLTRYSMYFNKKYNRKGSLFQGSYKSIFVEDPSSLLLLTRYLHQIDGSSTTESSSYPEYLEKRQTPWLNTSTVLALFEENKNKKLQRVNNYKDYVEKYNIDSEDEKQLEKIIFKKTDEIKSTIDVEETEEIYTPNEYKAHHYILTALVFVLFFGMGLNNVLKATAIEKVEQTISEPILEPQVSGESTENKPPPVQVLVVAEDVENVNIREKPTTSSPIIDKVYDGELYDFISSSSGWYEIKINEDEIGFIYSRYAEILNNEK